MAATAKKVNKEASKHGIEINKGASKVANAVAKVYETVSKNGNVVTQCVTSAQSVYKGEAIPTADLTVIGDEVARIREWSGKSARSRKSEVRTILKVYNRLGEAITAYGKKHASFTWHTAIKLARCLNREPSLAKALRLMDADAQAKVATPLATCGSAVKRIMGLKTRTVKIVGFQAGLTNLCIKHDIKWE